MESATSPATECGRQVSGVAQQQVCDEDPGIAALRALGADHLCPIRFRYAQALAQRLAVLQGEIRRVLDGRLTQLLADVALQVATLRTQWEQAMPALLQRHPQAAQVLRQLHAEGDVRALRRLLTRLDGPPRSGPVGELVRHIERQSHMPTPAADEKDHVDAGSLGVSPKDLKAVQRHKNVWARLRVEQQLTRSREQAPGNPGPLNSHLLVLRSLSRMQHIAPSYLAQFMSYADTLMWLDQAGSTLAPLPVKGVRPVPERKKSVRGRGRSV